MESTARSQLSVSTCNDKSHVQEYIKGVSDSLLCYLEQSLCVGMNIALHCLVEVGLVKFEFVETIAQNERGGLVHTTESINQ